LNWSAAKDVFPPMDGMMRWRVTVSMVIVALVVHVAWSCGWIPGVSGLARADEIDDKIDEKLEPVERKLELLATETAGLSELVKQSLKSQYSESIRRAASARCQLSNPSERRRINDTIERYQQDYESIAGTRYPIPACEDL